MEDNNNVENVTWSDCCPICSKEITFEIKRVGYRTYRAYIIGDGCPHFAPGYIDQCKYRHIVQMLKSLYEDIETLYSRIKKRQDLEKLKNMGVDITPYL